MTIVAPPDAELFLHGWLTSLFAAPSYRVVTETPADLGAVPTIQVSRFGGSSALITMDVANVDFDFFDVPHDGKSAYENAAAGARQLRGALLYNLPGYHASGVAVQSVTEISAFRWVPYDNTTLRRMTGAYRITIHSTPS